MSEDNEHVVELSFAGADTGPLPDGWIARPSDTSADIQMAYDPRLVSAMTTGPDLADSTRGVLEDHGYEPLGKPDQAGMQVWTADVGRLAQASLARLDRLAQQAPSADAQSIGLP